MGSLILNADEISSTLRNKTICYVTAEYALF